MCVRVNVASIKCNHHYDPIPVRKIPESYVTMLSVVHARWCASAVCVSVYPCVCLSMYMHACVPLGVGVCDIIRV